jgi:Protein of unknown function (DUF1553)/Protein of unknown function (DUF1549)/Planctomycete cytochrome C
MMVLPGFLLSCLALALFGATEAQLLERAGFSSGKSGLGVSGNLSRQVVELFQARCSRCHGVQKKRAGLDLTSLEKLARGSENGPVVAAGKPAESTLWKMIESGKMPPRPNPSLADRERALVRQWIEQGAAGLLAEQSPKPSTHWAFVPPAAPALPPVRQVERLRTPADVFIEARLEKRQLALGPEADRNTLIRRVSFDLTGLPPTPADVEQFLADQAPGAYERMVERYLASTHYGERWGKFWLDAAGYADSNGYFSADSDRPLAYRYRDYVIRSLNQDKPYDRFVREQLAGDEMAGYRPDRDVTPAMVDLLTATHFLRNAPDGTGESDGNPDEVRTDRYSVLEGNLQVTMSCLLGITIQCARCHGHKFEPIRHEEYYRLQAIFYPVYCPDRWVKPNDRSVLVGTRHAREAYERRTKQVEEQIKAYRTSLESLGAPLRAQLLDERLQKLDPAKRDAVLKARATAAEKRTAEQKALLEAQAGLLEISEDDLAKRFREFAAVRESIHQAIAAREQDRPHLDRLAAIVETDPQPPVHHLLLRGQHNAPGAEVQPGVPAALCTEGNDFRIDPARPGQLSTGRRTAFARWVTSPKNPLFARVMVNRVWQHHFGVGLVATPENLGQSGALPSHPALLDYLATEFIRSGWSLKTVHRLILISAVYRQTSALRQEAFRLDPENRLLWRYPLRRLDAEAVRDSMLAVSGELDLRSGGPFVPTERLPDGNVEVDENRPDARCRSIYLQQRRTQVATLLELFDAPSIMTNCTFRNTSTVPLQSLALLNSSFALIRAQGFARRLAREVGPDPDRRIGAAFQLACGREPSALERAAARRFLDEQQKLYSGEKEVGPRVWSDFCQMLLASNDFLYVE